MAIPRYESFNLQEAWGMTEDATINSSKQTIPIFKKNIRLKGTYVKPST